MIYSLWGEAETNEKYIQNDIIDWQVHQQQGILNA